MAKYKVKTGRRYIGFQMAQRVIAGFWAHVFIDCSECDQSIGLVFDDNNEADRLLDKKAKEIFESKGWLVDADKIILCPACKEKAKQND